MGRRAVVRAFDLSTFARRALLGRNFRACSDSDGADANPIGLKARKSEQRRPGATCARIGTAGLDSIVLADGLISLVSEEFD